MGLSFTIAAGPRQRSHSQVRVPWDSWPYFYGLRFETPSTCRARSSYLYPTGTGWPSYTPRHWVTAISQSQSYITTDGQSASLSWNKAPIWGLRQDLYYCRTAAGFLMWGALSDERTGLSLSKVTVSSNKSVVSMYNLHLMLFNICIYNIYRASVSPGSVQQIMPYH
jgi:hypothetical protein